MIQTHAKVGQTLDRCLNKLTQQQQALEAQRAGKVIHLNTRRRHKANWAEDTTTRFNLTS